MKDIVTGPDGTQWARAPESKIDDAAVIKPPPASAPLTPADLDTIEARADAATPGPWGDDYIVSSYSGSPIERPRIIANGRIVAHVMMSDSDVSDADFIAAARTDVPALVAEVRRLRDSIMPIVEHAARYGVCVSLAAHVNMDAAEEARKVDGELRALVIDALGELPESHVFLEPK